MIGGTLQKPRTSHRWVTEPTPQGRPSPITSLHNSVLPPGVILNPNHPLPKDLAAHSTPSWVTQQRPPLCSGSHRVSLSKPKCPRARVLWGNRWPCTHPPRRSATQSGRLGVQDGQRAWAWAGDSQSGEGTTQGVEGGSTDGWDGYSTRSKVWRPYSTLALRVGSGDSSRKPDPAVPITPSEQEPHRGPRGISSLYRLSLVHTQNDSGSV